MPTINIEGIGRVTPSDDFFQMSPADQSKEVDAFVKQFQARQEAQKPKDYVAPTTPEGNTILTPEGAAQNRADFANSAVGVAKNIAHTVMHPIETAQNIGTVAKGAAQEAGVISGEDAKPAAEAAWKALVDRYGSIDAVKKTMTKDPVGFLMDASAALGVGGLASGSRTLSGVAAAADPLQFAGRAAATVAKPAGSLASQALGVTTGAGSTAIKTAYQAGREGGEAGQAFREGLTGADTAATAVNDAKGALSQLREQRGAAYKEAMAGVKGDTEVLDFGKVDKAVEKVSDVKNFKGQDIDPATADIRAKMVGAVEEWKQLPAEEFHTVEGLDALKQKLGSFYAGTEAGTPANRVAGEIYNSVRQTIIDQAPEYAKIMKGYEEASGVLKEIEKTLSLGKGASIDTSLRKLQSVLRNNVNTNYGRRVELLDYLQRNGAPNLLQRLAGQALSSGTPRGLARLAAGGEGIGALALALTHPGVAATLAGGVLGSSPALVGGAAYGLGAGARAGGLVAPALGQAAFQLGRTQ